MPMFPFEVSLEEILQDPEAYVDSVFSCLESEFLVMPKGAGFVEYPVFERGYEALKAATDGLSIFDPAKIYPITVSDPISIVVLRTMLGFGVRREDMKKMILATRGKVFTAKTLDRLVECTRLREFKANQK